MSAETVMFCIWLTFTLIVGAFLWHLNEEEKETKVEISQQIEEKKEDCLFGWQAFCLNGKLYIRDPQTKGFGVAFTLPGNYFTRKRHDISCVGR